MTSFWWAVLEEAGVDGIRHRWQHEARRPNPALHLVSSGLAPCFYVAAALSSHLTVKE